MDEARERLQGLSLTPNEAARFGIEINRDGRRRTAHELMGLPSVTFQQLSAVWPELASLPADLVTQLVIDAQYAPYMDRQSQDVAMLRRDEALSIPPRFDYALPGLSAELTQKLQYHRPATLAQAARIEGITPAALMLVLAHVKKQARLSAQV